jgi:hypothetical protein
MQAATNLLRLHVLYKSRNFQDKSLTLLLCLPFCSYRLVCTDTTNTLADIAAETAAGTNIEFNTPLAMAVGNAVGKDVAFCSRSWKWEW